MKFTVASKCLYNRDGKCYFLVSDPKPCALCFNFASTDPQLKKELKIDKPVITFYDLIMSDSRYSALFPRTGESIQMSLGSLYSRTNKLPNDK